MQTQKKAQLRKRMEDELCTMYKYGTKKEAQWSSNILWKRYKSFVYNIARPFHRPENDIDSLANEGFMGFLNGVKAYNIGSKAKLLSYAGMWVKPMIMNATVKDEYKTTAPYASLHYRINREITSDGLISEERKAAVCVEQNISMKKLEALIYSICASKKDGNVIFDENSFEDFNFEEDNQYSCRDLDQTSRRAHRLEVKKQLSRAVDSLPRQMNEVVKRWYLDEKGGGYLKTSKCMGVSGQRISVVRKKAFEALRKKPEVQSLLADFTQ